VVHQPVSCGFAVFADAWLSSWLAEISADLRENGSALEMVLHDYALYKSTFTLLYLLVCLSVQLSVQGLASRTTSLFWPTASALAAMLGRDRHQDGQLDGQSENVSLVPRCTAVLRIACGGIKTTQTVWSG